MGQMADEAAEVLSTSGTRWSTLRAAGREWRNTVLSTRAWQAQLERRRAEGQRFTLISNQATGTRPEEIEGRWSLRLAGPRERATFEAGNDEVDVVFHESTWWSNGHAVSRTNGGAANYGHGKGPGMDLVETAAYPPLIEIREVKEGSRLGRSTLDALVMARRELERRRGRGLHGLVIGDADEIRLEYRPRARCDTSNRGRLRRLSVSNRGDDRSGFRRAVAAHHVRDSSGIE